MAQFTFTISLRLSQNFDKRSSATSPAPQIAFLVSGQTRAFETSSVRRSLNDHLFKAFSKGTNARQFFYLKNTGDTRGLDPDPEIKQQDPCMRSQRYTWSKMQPNVWTVQKIGTMEIFTTKVHAIPHCIGSWTDIKSWVQVETDSVTFKELDPDVLVFTDYNDHPKLQMSNEQACFPELYNDMTHRGHVENVWGGTYQKGHDIVQEWEEKNNMNFDIIVYNRPDLLFTQNFPLSYEDMNWHEEWLWSVDEPDFLWVMPRHIARDVLQTFKLRNECHPGERCCRALDDTDEREGANCCSSSYYIQNYWHQLNNYTLRSIDLHGVCHAASQSKLDKNNRDSWSLWIDRSLPSS